MSEIHNIQSSSHLLAPVYKSEEQYMYNLH